MAFILSIIVYLISKQKHKVHSYSFILKILGLLSVLAVVKPLFSIFIPILLLGVIPVFYRSVFKTNFLFKLLGLLLVSSFFWVQLIIMKVNHDVYKISNIGEETFTYYFFAKGIQEMQGLDRQESRDTASTYSTSKMFKHIVKNNSVYTDVYLSNLEENLNGNPGYLTFPAGLESWGYFRFMKTTNLTYYYLHIVFAFLTFLAFIKSLISKNKNTIIQLIMLICLLYSILLTSGLPFWQGDRLVVPATVVWIPLYLYSLVILFKKKNKLNSI